MPRPEYALQKSAVDYLTRCVPEPPDGPAWTADVTPMKWRTCKMCGVRKSEKHYARQSSASDGLYTYCKPCAAERARHNKPILQRRAKAFMRFVPPVCNWRLVPGFENRYAVTEDGRVWSFPYQGRNGRWYGGGWIKPLKGHTYLQVNLHDEKHKSRTKPIHRIMCEAFHGPPPTNKHQVAHNNGQRHDNRASNLRWATAKENSADRVLHGVDNIGERNGRATINGRQAKRIKSRIQIGESTKEIALSENVSRNVVDCIRHGKSWRYI